MRNKTLFPSFLLFFLVMGLAGPAMFEAFATETGKAKTILLPTPKTTGGKPLMEALGQRHANREFDKAAAISPQDLSNLLWASWGINRPDGRRTAPTAHNRQELEVYAAMNNGVWRYDAASNSLVAVMHQDVRDTLGGAPLTLLYAAPTEDPFGAMHIGALYQNAGLYCASAGLANVVKRTGADALDGALPLPKGYKVYIIQDIGWPEKTK